MTNTERKDRIRWVPLGKTRISPVAQRQLRPAFVATITAEFDERQLGFPVVSERDGFFNIVDGQHRIEMLKGILGDGWEEQQIECEVLIGLTEQEEAEEFLRRNKSLSVSTFDKFMVGVTAGRPEETEINRIVRSEGLVVSREKVEGAIMAVDALRTVYNRSDGETLGRTLRICRDSWGDGGMKGPVIKGVGLVCQRFNGEVPEELAVERLAGIRGGVHGLLNKATVIKHRTGGQVPHCVAAAVVEVIKNGTSGKKLPDWWKAVS